VCIEPNHSTTTGNSFKCSLLISFIEVQGITNTIVKFSPMADDTGTRGLGNPRDLNRGRRTGEQVSVAGWENSHTHNRLYRGSGTGRGGAEDVVVGVAGPEPGGQSAVPERCRQTDGQGRAEDQEARTQCRRRAKPNRQRNAGESCM